MSSKKGAATAKTQAGGNGQKKAGKSSAKKSLSVEQRREAIARRAYEKFAGRGYQHGNADQDWLEAEREIDTENG